MLKQRTIKTPVHAIGIGVHSGEKVRMTLRPAPENTGIVFVRTDVFNRPSIRACAENVSDTTLATSLGGSGVQVAQTLKILRTMF